MLNKILGGFVGLVAALFALGFVLPDRAHLEREIVVHAPPEDIFALISDFDAWNAWSPWSSKRVHARKPLLANHAMRSAVSADGTHHSIGQRILWASDVPQIGTGMQEIVALAAPGHVVTRLDLGSMGEADAAFTLTPLNDGSTKVVWTYHSNTRADVPVYLQPVSTYMGYIMDPMLGPSYERGLQNLKRVAEAS